MSRLKESFVITIAAHKAALSVVVDRAVQAEECCKQLLQLISPDCLTEHDGDWVAATQSLVGDNR